MKEQHASVPLRRSRSFECLVEEFLYELQGRLPWRPPAALRPDDTTVTGVPASPSNHGGASRHERPVSTWGMLQRTAADNPESTTDPSACRFTCADAADHPARNHTVYGMQGVRGSNPSAPPGTTHLLLRSERHLPEIIC